MKLADSNEFKREFLKMAVAFQHAEDTNELTVYFEALSGYTLEELIPAMRDAIQTQEYFPRPAQIIEAITKRRREYQPEKNYKCEMCRGTGFVTVYLRYDSQKHQELCPGEIKTPANTQWAIDHGIFSCITESEYYNASATDRVASYAKRCDCRGPNMLSKSKGKGKSVALLCLGFFL